MSGRDNRGAGGGGGGGHQPLSSAMGKLKEKLTRAGDDQGYHRVESNLSTSNTATSLDTILPEDPFLFPQAAPHRHPQPRPQQQPQQQHQHQQLRLLEDEPPLSFRPLLEDDDINEPPTQALQQRTPVRASGSLELTPLPPPPTSQEIREHRDRQQRSVPLPVEELQRSKQSLKGSRVSFEKNNASSKQAAESSDDDSFEDKRIGFQQQKATSVDHKGILKDLKHILANDNRRQFQAKKHVSLDVKGTRFLQDLLKESSSEEEFHKTRREFQGRKHQSLDPRVTFKLDKVLQGSSTDSDEEGDDAEHKRLIHRPKDITKPVIIDLKDLESESDEDFHTSRQHFQQQRSISTDSRKSRRLYEMDEMGNKRGENIRHAVPFVRQITEDGKPKLEVYRPTTNPIYIWTQVLAALSVSLGSLVVGFVSAYTSPALVSMTNGNITSFEVTAQAASWVGGIMPLAGLAGGIAGGPFIEYLGRRNTILATAIPFIVSSLLIACAVNVAMVLAGRFLAGFCVGIASLSLPVYLGETVQPEVRGTLGLLPTAFGNIGILLCFVAGTYMDWSMLAFLGAALPVPFLVLMFLIPETPRWFVSRGREERARKALTWLRGKEADVEPELKGLMRSQADADRQATQNKMLELLKRNNLKPLSISLGLMFFQQLSGINAVIFYTVSIFKDAGSTIDGNVCTIIVGVVNFLATFIATLLIDRAGRKILLYVSNIAMIITLFVLGGFFYCKAHGPDVSHLGWLPLSCFVIYILGFSLGFGPIPWLMMGEILPSKIRGSAASVATAFNWSCTFVVTKTFQDMIDFMGAHGAFWLFGSICFIGLFFVILYVPETQGKTLEDIERKMMGRVRRMSSVANMKPLAFNM
ncbi:facilitated trehalose transporter Tret1 isoform X1 [Drosophila guanche]|uniref:Blast:Facilitated trehalose transporter Tret1 n=1 Tax=Drosophila guanche TaxID=7266 RepID=A0A3B0J1D3_DROGU|nr:facilitated trehalose transporter Tret1 isoform X1 [Drosophila guanche]XP_034141181.1 facilitated trehalose transporter Tret1 isoform X1 [Drosophila guanche]SPP74695.1 blast:Facilitated trehalose transporter Tret1 [Drosophila guanche]